MLSMYRMTTPAQARPPSRSAPVVPQRADARRIQVRRSGVHGKGVFALRLIVGGERIIEYRGDRISWREANRRHPHDPAQPNHTFYFHVDDKTVIDGHHNGNASRWINHSCAPNCDAVVDEGRIWIESIRDIPPGEELAYDYAFTLVERHTPAAKRRYPCHCGAVTCRKTMLAKKR